MANYPYIRAWGQIMHSRGWYVDEQVKLAQRDRAPHDAIYKRDEKWVTASQITSGNTRALVEQTVVDFTDD